MILLERKFLRLIDLQHMSEFAGKRNNQVIKKYIHSGRVWIQKDYIFGK